MMPGAGRPETRCRRDLEEGLRRPDEAFREEREQSPLALGPREFRERMRREHEERGHVRREDVSLRHVRAIEKTPGVLAEVCGEPGLRPSDIRLRRRDRRDRDGAVLAPMRRCGLTGRAAAAEPGLSTGSALSYLVRQVKARCRVEPGTADLVRHVAHAEVSRRSRNAGMRRLMRGYLLFCKG
jgi:hypothetical protein